MHGKQHHIGADESTSTVIELGPLQMRSFLLRMQ
jgi:hypothetical protein